MPGWSSGRLPGGQAQGRELPDVMIPEHRARDRGSGARRQTGRGPPPGNLAASGFGPRSTRRRGAGWPGARRSTRHREARRAHPPARSRRPSRGPGCRRAGATSTCSRPRPPRGGGTGPAPARRGPRACRPSPTHPPARPRARWPRAPRPRRPRPRRARAGPRRRRSTSPRFCHGSPATTSNTRSSVSAARASDAATRCPTWTGSNVPPSTPTRSIGRSFGVATRGSIRADSGAPDGVHLAVTCPKCGPRTLPRMKLGSR